MIAISLRNLSPGYSVATKFSVLPGQEVSQYRRLVWTRGGARTDDSGGGDERVDAAESVDNLLERRLDALLVGDVAPDTDALNLALLGLSVLLEPLNEVVRRLLGEVLVEVKNRDRVRARLGESTGHQVSELLSSRRRVPCQFLSDLTQRIPLGDARKIGKVGPQR